MTRMVPLLGILLIGWLGVPPWTQLSQAKEKDKAPAPSTAKYPVYLLGQLKDSEIVALTTALATREPKGTILIDSPLAAKYNQIFLKEFRPDRVVALGSFSDGLAALGARLGVPINERYDAASPVFWQSLFPRA